MSLHYLGDKLASMGDEMMLVKPIIASKKKTEPEIVKPIETV